MSLKLATRWFLVLTFVGVGVVTADPLDKLPRDVRLKFLESLKIGNNGRPASAFVGEVKKHLSKEEYRQFMAMFGWGSVVFEDHKDMECVKAGTCGHANGFVCDPSACKDPCKCSKLGDLVRVLSPYEQTEFLMALRFNNGRATNLPLHKIRRRLTPDAVAELEKMARQ